MSAHSSAGIDCPGCKRRFVFIDRHIPHCADALAKLIKSGVKVKTHASEKYGKIGTARGQ